MAISGLEAVSGVSVVYGIYFKYHHPISPNPVTNTPRGWQIGSFHSLFNSLINNQDIDKSKGIEDKSKEDCKLCQGRRYICSNGETSDGISTVISGRQSELRVQAHEAQHLHQARIKAAREGKVVISQHIFLQHSICPECGGSYVSSGQAVTHTLSRQEFQQIRPQPQSSKSTYQPSDRLNDQKPEGKGINIDFYG